MLGAAPAQTSRSLLPLLGLTLAVGLAGCGPTQSTAYQLDAETMLAAATTAQAETLATYEWTAARLYLEKSKEEVGYSEFEQAIDYARKAVELATRARDTALKAARRAEPPAPPTDAP
jgi:hypothetical protein